MGSLSPLQIALLIIAAVSIVGMVIAVVRSRRTYSEYEEIAGEARRLGSIIKGEIFRDGNDLVVSGNYGMLPTVVRFSNDENTPGLNMRMQAPATLTLSLVPSGVTPTEGGRIPVRTADEMLDARFTTRTDQPTQAKMFLTRSTTARLSQLCCSKGTFVSVGQGAIEVSELVIPSPGTSQHISEHLKTLALLSEDLRMMPGADKVKVVPFKRERNLAGRVAIAAGAVVAVISIFAATQVPSSPAAGQAEVLASGILPLHAAHIPGADKWRVANADDFDPVCVHWLRNNGGTPEGKVEGDFSGSGLGNDTAYVLVGANNARRIVILTGVDNRYDTQFPFVGMATRIPKQLVNSIRWVGGAAPRDVQGDGLLIVRRPNDVTSGIVLFLNGRNIISGAPENYQDISLR